MVCWCSCNRANQDEVCKVCYAVQLPSVHSLIHVARSAEGQPLSRTPFVQFTPTLILPRLRQLVFWKTRGRCQLRLRIARPTVNLALLIVNWSKRQMGHRQPVPLVPVPPSHQRLVSSLKRWHSSMTMHLFYLSSLLHMLRNKNNNGLMRAP